MSIRGAAGPLAADPRTLRAPHLPSDARSYLAMAWVGGTFYVLHYPAILFTMAMGNRLLALYAPFEEEQQQQSQDVEGGGDGGSGHVPSAGGAAGSLTEPLLATTSSAHATPTSHFAHHGGAQQGGGGRQTSPMAAPPRAPGSAASGGDVGRMSTSFRAGSLHRAGSVEQRNLGKRTSIPGHASPILGSGMMG